MATDLVEMFTSIGLSEQKANETLKNEQLAKFLKEIIVEVSMAVYWTGNDVHNEVKYGWIFSDDEIWLILLKQ